MRLGLAVKRSSTEEGQADCDELTEEAWATSERRSRRYEAQQFAQLACVLHAANLVNGIGARQLDEGIDDTFVSSVRDEVSFALIDFRD